MYPGPHAVTPTSPIRPFVMTSIPSPQRHCAHGPQWPPRDCIWQMLLFPSSFPSSRHTVVYAPVFTRRDFFNLVSMARPPYFLCVFVAFPRFLLRTVVCLVVGLLSLIKARLGPSPSSCGPALSLDRLAHALALIMSRGSPQSF